MTTVTHAYKPGDRVEADVRIRDGNDELIATHGDTATIVRLLSGDEDDLVPDGEAGPFYAVRFDHLSGNVEYVCEDSIAGLATTASAGLWTVAAYLDTAYFRAVEPFDGREDDPKTDAAATKIWAVPCGIGDGWDVTLTIDRTNIRLDMSYQEARKLAERLTALAS